MAQTVGDGGSRGPTYTRKNVVKRRRNGSSVIRVGGMKMTRNMDDRAQPHAVPVRKKRK